MESTSIKLFGREIPQVLLMHTSTLNADLMPEILALLRARGYRFVPLAAALADPAYQTPDRYVDGNGPSWFGRWHIALQKPFAIRDEPDPPRWVMDEYNRLQKR